MVFCVPGSEDGERYLLSPTGEIDPTLDLFNFDYNLLAKIFLFEDDMEMNPMTSHDSDSSNDENDDDNSDDSDEATGS
ncbi:hypothetical protein V9T40_012720 [Parthenolecanium corni]|uniref:Uncharacterized protein n=1 Tax=Parthenolecanium corni TaxID=536013 RepID=A0AAN9TBC6_9HEMI